MTRAPRNVSPMTTTTHTATETHTCTCAACPGGLSFTAPAGHITGTPKQVRDMVHNYAQGAHAPAGIGRIMADRAGIVAA